MGLLFFIDAIKFDPTPVYGSSTQLPSFVNDKIQLST